MAVFFGKGLGREVVSFRGRGNMVELTVVFEQGKMDRRREREREVWTVLNISCYDVCYALCVDSTCS